MNLAPQLDATLAALISPIDVEILTAVSDSVILADEQGNIVWMNPVALRLHGFHNLSEAQRPLSDYTAIFSVFAEDGTQVPPSDWPMARVLRGETLTAWNLEVRPLDGRPSFFVCFSGKPILSLDGVAHAAFLLARDLTQVKDTERDLRNAEEEKLIAFEAANMGSWDRDLRTNVVSLSHRAEQLFGLPPGRAVTSEDLLNAVHPADRQSLVDSLERAIREHSDYESESRVIAPDGTERWIASRGRASYDADGIPRRMQGVLIDITGRRRAEEELRAVQLQFHHSQKLESLGVLAGGVAHDFNNLLTGILGNASLVHDNLPPGDPNRLMLEEVVHAGERAADLTRQLLAYAGKGRFVTKLIYLSDLVREMHRLIRTSLPKMVHVVHHLPEALPAIEGDPSQVQQIVMNLLLNAAEAIAPNEPGTVLVEVSECHFDHKDRLRFFNAEAILAGHYISLNVHDTGTGMDEETKSRIFDPFFTTKFTGRGLGLSAVLGIVRGHKGALNVESEPGRGTSFTVLFPVAANQPEIITPPAVGGSEMVLAIGPCQEQMDRLRDLGYPVLFCHDLRLAEPILREGREPVAIVICSGAKEDIPGLVHKHRPGVPVFLSSGDRRSEQIRKHPGHRYSAFLHENSSPAELDRAIRQVISRG